MGRGDPGAGKRLGPGCQLAGGLTPLSRRGGGGGAVFCLRSVTPLGRYPPAHLGPAEGRKRSRGGGGSAASTAECSVQLHFHASFPSFASFFFTQGMAGWGEWVEWDSSVVDPPSLPFPPPCACPRPPGRAPEGVPGAGPGRQEDGRLLARPGGEGEGGNTCAQGQLIPTRRIVDKQRMCLGSDHSPPPMHSFPTCKIARDH